MHDFDTHNVLYLYLNGGQHRRSVLRDTYTREGRALVYLRTCLYVPNLKNLSHYLKASATLHESTPKGMRGD